MEQILSQYGLAGLVIATLAGVNVYQNRKLESKDKRIEELQELRLVDSKEVAKNVTEVLQGNSEASRILAEKIEIARGNRNAVV